MNSNLNHRRMNPITCTLVPAFIALLAAGCSSAQGMGEDEVSSSSEPILKGKVVSAAQTGHVQGPGCSGELLSNDWVLTAKHCFNYDGELDPSTLKYTMGTQSKTADRYIIQTGDFYHDAAVVHLSQPFTMNNKTTGYSRPLYNGTTASLIGKTVTCYGYGPGTVNGPIDGTLRSMTSAIGGSVPDAYTYYIATNSAGQTCLPGDSGGSCIYNGQQVGIAREQWNNGPNNSPGTCDWTTTTTDGARTWILTAAASYVQPFDNGDHRGYTGDGDWAPGSYKGQCKSGDSIVGIAATSVAQRADERGHAALCAPQYTASTQSGLEKGHVLTGPDDRADTNTGDWDPGYYKAECGANEVMTGIAQTPGSFKMSKILCNWFYAEVMANDSSCKALVFSNTSDNRRNNTDTGDWAWNYSKNECASNQILKGVSANPNTGEIHAILCCDTVPAPH